MTSNRPRGEGAVRFRADEGTKRGPSFLYQRAKHGYPTSYPLLQFPNAPFFVGVLGLLVSGFTDGSLHDYASAVFFGGLAVWAWLEVTNGVNWARRALGAAALVYFVIMVGHGFGA